MVYTAIHLTVNPLLHPQQTIPLFSEADPEYHCKWNLADSLEYFLQGQGYHPHEADPIFQTIHLYEFDQFQAPCR